MRKDGKGDSNRKEKVRVQEGDTLPSKRGCNEILSKRKAPREENRERTAHMGKSSDDLEKRRKKRQIFFVKERNSGSLERKGERQGRAKRGNIRREAGALFKVGTGSIAQAEGNFSLVQTQGDGVKRGGGDANEHRKKKDR